MVFGRKKLSAFTDTAIGIYKVKFFRKIGDRYVCIDTVNLKIEDIKPFRYKGKDFQLFDKTKFGWTDKSNFYAIDYDNGQQLVFSTIDIKAGKVTLDDIDNYVNKGIIAQLVAGLEKAKSDKGQWIMLIIVGVLGGVIGFMAGEYAASQSATKEVAKMALMLVI